MSKEQLLAALEREGERLLAVRRAAADAELSQLRLEHEADLAGRRAAAEQHWQVEADALQRQRAAQAARLARQQRLEAESRLAGRLRTLAAELLPELACASATCLTRLAAELPRLAWQEVRVHPRDRDAAQRLFPEAGIVEDATLCGGLAVTTPAGRIHIDNTLEKRLERLWDDLLPLLVTDATTQDDVAQGGTHADVVERS